MHWADAYIGAPFESGASGPAAYDCWGLLRAVLREHFGRVLPALGHDARSLRSCVLTAAEEVASPRWRAVELPAEGDAVLMARARHPSHVGVWLDADGGRVLHCLEGAGVVCVPPRRLALDGWQVRGLYRWVGA